MTRRRRMVMLRVWGSGLAALTALGLGGVSAVAQDPAASPGPTRAADVGVQVDPRSNGEGPGLEAEPLIVLAGVVMLGIAAAGGTLLYVRVTKDD